MKKFLPLYIILLMTSCSLTTPKYNTDLLGFCNRPFLNPEQVEQIFPSWNYYPKAMYLGDNVAIGTKLTTEQKIWMTQVFDLAKIILSSPEFEEYFTNLTLFAQKSATSLNGKYSIKKGDPIDPKHVLAMYRQLKIYSPISFNHISSGAEGVASILEYLYLEKLNAQTIRFFSDDSYGRGFIVLVDYQIWQGDYNRMVYLARTVTHEVGHIFGFAHDSPIQHAHDIPYAVGNAVDFIGRKYQKKFQKQLEQLNFYHKTILTNLNFATETKSAFRVQDIISDLKNDPNVEIVYD